MTFGQTGNMCKASNRLTPFDKSYLNETYPTTLDESEWREISSSCDQYLARESYGWTRQHWRHVANEIGLGLGFRQIWSSEQHNPKHNT